jgi:hypothetical protein
VSTAPNPPVNAVSSDPTTPNTPDTFQVTLTYDYDGDKKLETPVNVVASITSALADVFRRAVVINENNPPPLSFSSLLISMMMGTDSAGSWLSSYMKTQGVSIQQIASHSSRSVDESSVLSRASSMTTLPPFGATNSARRAIEQAQEIAAALGRNIILDVRHLAAAYPVLSNWHVEDFRDLGIDRLQWCRAYGAMVAGIYPAEKRYWRDYADRASPVPLTSFSADVYTERDLLGIDRSVEALALLISSTRTDTPLSIGVFGQWGSGKSFFMQHLRHRIWKVAAREKNRDAVWVKKRQSGTATEHDIPLYFSQIAQVEFNAWHYNDGNIVASLVDHLFRNLQVQPDPSDEELEKRRTAMLLEISGARDRFTEAAQVVEQTRAKFEDANAQMERAKNEARDARAAVATTARDLDTHAQAARQEIQAAIDRLGASAARDLDTVPDEVLNAALESPVLAQAKGAAETMLRDLESWRTFARRLFTARGAVVLALLLLPPLVTAVVSQLHRLWTAAAGTGAILAATAVVSQVFAFFIQRRREFDATMDRLDRDEARRRDEKRTELQRQVQSLKDQWNTRVGQLRGSVADSRAALEQRESELATVVGTLTERTTELEAKMRERMTAEKTLKDAEEEYARISSTRLLEEFLKSRLATDEYRKQLGFLALVRRDFERLSDLIARANAEWCDPAKTTAAPSLNRIVLYIDDLDRCSQETVLKVLEIVHLLLAFRLFVCVVAVDPRWIEDCLAQKHSYLFGMAPVNEKENGTARTAEQEDGSARATVGDYLEKIFQIPIWTSPIEREQRASMVKAILGKSATPAPQAQAGGEAVEGAHKGPQDSDGAHSGGAGSDAFQVLRKRAEDVPDPLRITSEETEYMDAIAGLLSERPRALKRFVNTYRLLKASLPDINRASFVTTSPSSPHKICLIQLALFTGQPRLAPVFVQQLHAAKNGCISLDSWFVSLDQNVRTRFGGLIDLVPDRANIQFADFCAWLADTSKYLFHREG